MSEQGGGKAKAGREGRVVWDVGGVGRGKGDGGCVSRRDVAGVGEDRAGSRGLQS